MHGNFCKSDVSDFGGSNPPPPTNIKKTAKLSEKQLKFAVFFVVFYKAAPLMVLLKNYKNRA